MIRNLFMAQSWSASSSGCQHGLVQVVRRLGGVICLFALICSCCLHTLLTRSANMTEYSCGAFICSAPTAWLL